MDLLIGLPLLGIGFVVTVVWVIFPFILFSKMNDQIRVMLRIERHMASIDEQIRVQQYVASKAWEAPPVADEV